MTGRIAAALALAALLAACTSSPDETAAPPPREEPEPEAPAAEVFPLTAREVLVRASLDVRGVRPTEAEHAALEADPAALEALLDGFLADERFGARVRAIFAPVLRTQLDAFTVSAAAYGIDDEAGFAAAVGDEPLRLISHVAEHDLPFTEVVTADYTLANELLARAWPLDYPGGATGWRVARYTDSRPPAGILSQNAFHWRYPSDGVNYGRGRANALARILLCQSYLGRPVDFPREIDLSDEAAIRTAVTTNPGCLNCHVGLDPLASFLFGFQYTGFGAAELSRYHPERERAWRTATGVAPSYYGVPGHTLADLGQAIAGDPRFVECAVKNVYEGLLGREVGLFDQEALTRHREAFLEGGLRLRPLVRSVLSDERYRGQVPEADGGVRRKLVAPELLGSQLEALTGFRFTAGGADMLRTDTTGLRSLAGGVDAFGGSAPARAPNATVALVHERLAEAAGFAELSRAEGERRLLAGIDTGAGDEAAVRRALVVVHRRLFGTAVAEDGPEVEAGAALFAELASVGSVPDAWAGVTSALLRDPELVLY